jgi:hypothetical protein
MILPVTDDKFELLEPINVRFKNVDNYVAVGRYVEKVTVLFRIKTTIYNTALIRPMKINGKISWIEAGNDDYILSYPKDFVQAIGETLEKQCWWNCSYVFCISQFFPA